MSIKLRLKHSSVADKAPLPTDLVEGELALNINNTSPAAYIKDSAGAVVKLAGLGSVSTVDATEIAKGIVELATAVETTTGTDDTRAVHPAGLKVELDKKVKLAGDTMTGNLTVPSVNNGPLAGMRNAIINGNFDFWQRGTSFTSSGYGTDRWMHRLSGATTHIATRQAFTAGQTDVPGEPAYFCRTVVSSVAGAGNYARLDQQIEDVRTFAGQQVTLSFWAKADAIKNIAVTLQQYFGTGGSPSAPVNISATKVSIGTSWQKVTVTVTVPSLSGKTLGTNNDHSMVVVIWFDAGSSFDTDTDTLGQQSGTFDIAQVQIEPGPVATPFERRPIGTELSLCQRYFCTTKAVTRFRSAVANEVAETPVYWPMQMRVNPSTITIKAGTRSNISSVIFQSDNGTTGGRHIVMAAAANLETFSIDDMVSADAEL